MSFHLPPGDDPVHDRRFTTVAVVAPILSAVLAIGTYLLLRLDGQPLPLQHTAMFVVAAVVHVAVFATTRPWWRPTNTTGGDR